MCFFEILNSQNLTKIFARFLHTVQVGSHKCRRIFKKELLSYFAKIWLNILVNHRHFGYKKKMDKKKHSEGQRQWKKKESPDLMMFFFFLSSNKTKFGCPEERRRLFSRRRRRRSLIVLRFSKMCVRKLLLFCFVLEGGSSPENL